MQRNKMPSFSITREIRREIVRLLQRIVLEDVTKGGLLVSTKAGTSVPTIVEIKRMKLVELHSVKG